MTTTTDQNIIKLDAVQTAKYRQGQFARLEVRPEKYLPKVKFIGTGLTQTNYMDISGDELAAIQAILTKAAN